MDPMENSPQLSDSTFRKFTALIYERAGINLKDYKKYLVENRLSRFVGPGRDYPSFDAYHDALLSDKTGAMLSGFVNAMTTNWSYFFRDEVHFEFLADYLRVHAHTEPYLRFWSAAGSTGEEAWSMAVTCRETLPDVDRLDLKILASDISTKVIEEAQRGTYLYKRLSGHVDEKIIRRHFRFDPEAKTFTVNDDLRRLVAVRYLNLLGDYPFTRKFDIVFLRNILIYFEVKEKAEVIARVAQTIKPGGYLILGLSESLVGVPHRLTGLRNSVFQVEGSAS